MLLKAPDLAATCKNVFSSSSTVCLAASSPLSIRAFIQSTIIEFMMRLYIVLSTNDDHVVILYNEKYLHK